MAFDLIAFPFTSQVTYDEEGLPVYDRAVDSTVLRKVFKQYFTDGVFADPATNFKVQPIDGGLTVQVAIGAGTIQGTSGYTGKEETFELEAAGSTNRVDAIVLRWDDSLDVRKIQLDVIRGANNGVCPLPTRTDTIHELIIAYVTVRAGTTSILTTDIEDTRLNTSLCGLVRIPMNIPDTDPYFEQIQAYINYLREVIDGVIGGSEYMLKTRYDPRDEVFDIAEYVFNTAHPIGSYYTSEDPTHPADVFGRGTWVRAAIGKMLVGVNENDTPFNAPGKTGGSQTHTLAEGNLPSHRHSVPALSGTAASAGAHSHTIPALGGTAASAGGHTHVFSHPSGNTYSEVGVSNGQYIDQGGAAIIGSGVKYSFQGSYMQTGGAHTHSVTTTASASGSSGAHTHTVTTTASNTGYLGSGIAVNHMSPFETAYIWKRTA